MDFNIRFSELAVSERLALSPAAGEYPSLCAGA